MIDRYSTSEMNHIWSLERKFQTWLDIEIYALEAFQKLGHIPEEDVAAIKTKATFDVDRILELEQQTRHDVVAFTRNISESLGEEKKYVHYGLTSSDVVDTALSSLMSEAVDLIIEELDNLLTVLKEMAEKYKQTVMMGRTHGVHAEPTTLGIKFALFYSEMQRNRLRLVRAKESISVGKISGAVGTYANIPPFVEEYVCEQMGLLPAPISTQILQRDRHAELLTTLGIIAGTMDKLATEIRHLQKTETREVEEPFYKGQKGSSAMPHKRNPVNCEKVSGLSRVIRSNAMASLENQPLWHERDISHSSTERVIIPDSTTLVHYLLKLMARILADLHVYPDNMTDNINKTYGLVFSQRVLLTLIDKGLSREDAYDLVQGNAMKSWEEGINFYELLIKDQNIMSLLTPEELHNCFDLEYYTKHVDRILNKVFDS